MSSDGTTLDVQDYRRLLDAHLSVELAPLTNFFCNIRRIDVLTRFLRTHCPKPPQRVLNVGCGPFAIECFAAPLAASEFVSFDYTASFARVYDALRSNGNLPNTSFFVGNATEVEFKPCSFDLILMHDLLYEPDLDAATLLFRHHVFLKPGGLLFFDVMDQRTARLWKVLGREIGHRRYDVDGLCRQIERHYEIVDCVPNLGIKGPLDALFRRVLWNAFGLANNVAILIRRR